MTDDTPVVRTGMPDDVHDVMRLTMECHAENGFVSANTGKMLEEVYSALSRHHGIVGVIGGMGRPMEGCVVLRMGTVPYSDVDVLEEKFLFVNEHYRAASIGRARLLAEFAKKTSDDLDLPLLIGILSNERTKAKIRLYTRTFGEPAGAFFLYNAKTGVFRDKGDA